MYCSKRTEADVLSRRQWQLSLECTQNVHSVYQEGLAADQRGSWSWYAYFTFPEYWKYYTKNSISTLPWNAPITFNPFPPSMHPSLNPPSYPPFSLQIRIYLFQLYFIFYVTFNFHYSIFCPVQFLSSCKVKMKQIMYLNFHNVMVLVIIEDDQ